MTKIPSIPLGGHLEHLIKSCEKSCVAGCCGLGAFDFSPLHIASHISTHTGAITDEDLRMYEAEISELEKKVICLTPNDDGYLCEIPEMCHWFRIGDFKSFLAGLRHGLRMSPQVLALSDSLRCAALEQ